MRILLGRAGSGKTARLMDEIAAASAAGRGRQYLIVPELFSHAYERRLAEATVNRGARTAEVLSFTRLAGRVFAETGGLAQAALDGAGRLLTLHEAVRRVEGNLTAYPGLSDRPGLEREVLDVLDECRTCRKTAADLFDGADALRAEGDFLLAGKLTDLGQIAAAYDRLCETGLPDPRTLLDRLADALPESTVLDGAAVYIDGFASFTPQELTVLERMLEKKLDLTVALTCDRAQPEVFVSACKTAQRLTRMAARRSIPVETIDLGGGAARPHDLARLERWGLTAGGTPEPSDGESVRVVRAETPFDECLHAAAFIRRKVRETGARWRDFAVAVRSMEGYAAGLEMAMQRFDVPVFLSEKADLLRKPPLALVTGALAAVAGGLRYEDVFGCLKTGLCAAEPDEVDRLENYVLTWNIRGGAWLRDWTMHPDGYGLAFDDDARTRLDALNALRARVIAPFARLREGLGQVANGRDCVTALYDFLLEEEVPDRMAGRAAAHEAAGRLQAADEYRQLWDIVAGALEQTAWVCGQTPMTAGRFAELFSLVLSEYDVGTIPVALDRVTCGPIERVCRQPVKYLLLLGCNDGDLPRAPGPMSVLTESDRLTLDGIGLSLAAFGSERMLMEQETIYQALSCPTAGLVLSWHETDGAGRECRPSYLLGAFARLLPGLPQEGADTGRDSLEGVRPARELACAGLQGNADGAAQAALQQFAADPLVCRARDWTGARGPLTGEDTVAGLYGRNIRLTASRVDRYYACPFAYFMEYGLRAKPRRRADFAAPETGTFLHFVLETVLRALEAQPGGAAEASPRAVRIALRQAIEQYVNEVLGGLEDKTARFRTLFRRLERSAETILKNVLDELRSSDFAPIDFELDFSHGGDLPPVTCGDGEVTVELSGKVDRVDGYLKGGRLYVRVMDYKSGRKSFSLSDIWYGLNMQLIIYLYALREEGLERYRARLCETLNEITPAGVLYVPARDDLPDGSRSETDEMLDVMRSRLLRRSGLLTDDMDVLEAMERGLSGEAKYIPVKVKVAKPTKKEPDPAPTLASGSSVADLARFGQLARHTRQKLLEMGRALRAGDVRAAPAVHGGRQQCEWCEYRAACRFDESAGDKPRLLRGLKDSEVWEMLDEEGKE